MINEIKRLKESLNENTPVYGVPYFNKKSEITVTFVSPQLNMEGFYSMILPYISLNKDKTNSHRCFITQINSVNKNQDYDSLNQVLRSDFIEQSDIIVLPFCKYDISYIIEGCKSVNKGVKVFYILDSNHIDNEIVLSNCKLADKCICMNKQATEKANELIGANKTYYLPLFYNPEFILDCYEKMNEKIEGEKVYPGMISKTANEKFRLLVIVNSKNHLKDLECYNEILRDFSECKDNELFIFGSSIKDINKHLKDVKYSHVKPISYFGYFEKLNSINPDCVFIPHNFDSDIYRNYSKIIEFQYLGKPVICPSIEPFKSMSDVFRGLPLYDMDNIERLLKLMSSTHADMKSQDINSMALNLSNEIISDNFDIHFNSMEQNNLKIYKEIFS